MLVYFRILNSFRKKEQYISSPGVEVLALYISYVYNYTTINYLKEITNNIPFHRIKND